MIALFWRTRRLDEVIFILDERGSRPSENELA